MVLVLGEIEILKINYHQEGPQEIFLRKRGEINEIFKNKLVPISRYNLYIKLIKEIMKNSCLLIKK